MVRWMCSWDTTEADVKQFVEFVRRSLVTHKRTKKWRLFSNVNGAPGEIRTPDLQLRRLPLYPAELRARSSSLHRNRRFAFQQSKQKLKTRKRAAENQELKSREPRAKSQELRAAYLRPRSPRSPRSPPRPPPPPPPPGRSVLGRASFTLMVRPPTSVPFSRGDGFLAFFGIGHFHKGESARSPGFAIGQNAYAIHLSVSLEKLAQLIFNRVEAEVSNENVFQGAPLSANRGAGSSKQKAVLPGFANARRV